MGALPAETHNLEQTKPMKDTIEDPKNEAPAGTPPASGSGSRGAGPEPDANTCSPQLGTFGGQGTGDLEGLLWYLAGQAAWWTKQAERKGFWVTAAQRTAARHIAAGYREWMIELGKAIGSPRPQSGEEGGEPCRLCEFEEGWGYAGCRGCGKTFEQTPDMESRVERSGPPNASGETRGQQSATPPNPLSP